jgi:hypothetical protein
MLEIDLLGRLILFAKKNDPMDSDTAHSPGKSPYRTSGMPSAKCKSACPKSLAISTIIGAVRAGLRSRKSSAQIQTFLGAHLPPPSRYPYGQHFRQFPTSSPEYSSSQDIRTAKRGHTDGAGADPLSPTLHTPEATRNSLAHHTRAV